MNALISLLAWGFWRASWQAGVLAAAVLLARQALGARLAPQWRCALWMLVTARLLLPIVPASAWSVFNLVPFAGAAVHAPIPQDTSSGYVFISALSPGLVPHGDAVVTFWHLSWTGLLQIIWLAGAMALAARLIAVNVVFAMRVRRAAMPADDFVTQWCADCAAEIGLARVPEIVRTSAVSTPALFGLWRACVLLPADFSQRLSRQEGRLVLLHEFAHLRRRDLTARWLISLAQIVHWFNPLAFLARTCWRGDMEAACDEAVLCNMDEEARFGYGLLLMKLAANLRPCAPPPAMAIVDGRAELRRRISAITLGNRPAARWSIAAAVLALALAFAGLTDARGDSPAAPTTAPQASELVVYTVGDIVSSAPAGAGEKSVPAEARTAWPATLAELTDLIKQRITPNVWSSAARIDADERTGQLVVLAPPDTQAAVAKFLGQMSKEAKTSITIRAYILTFDPSTAQSLKLPPNSEPMTLLTAERYQELLKAARNASPTGSNSILFAPKIITRNHEQCAVQVGTDTAYVSDIVPTNLPGKATVTASDGTIYEVKNATINAGFKLSIDPVISKDGKYVSVAFKAALTDLLGFQTATVNGNPLLKYQVPLVMTNSIEGEASVPNGGIVAMNLPVGQDDFPGSGATKPAHAGQVELILTATINP